MFKIRKRFLSLISLLILVALVMAGCSDSGSGSADNGDEDKMTVGMVIINQEALFFTQMVEGAQAKADELGIELAIYNANNDPVKQNNAIQDFVSEGVDAIIVNAIDTNGIIPAMQDADKAGIPVISVDSIVEDESVSVQIGVDNRKASEELAAYFNEFAPGHWDGEVQLGVVGALNSTIQVNRQDGFTETVENVNIVNIVDGENVQEKALTASESLFTGNPDLHAVFATGEPALIGATSAVRSQGKEDDILMFGWDLSQQAVEGIDEGWVEAVVQQHPEEYGSTAVQYALDLSEGNEVDSFVDVPATIVTSDNVDDFRSLFE